MAASDPALIKLNLQTLKQKELSVREIDDLINSLNKQNNDNGTTIVIEPLPSMPVLKDLTTLHFDETLLAIQQYIHAFEYNFTNLQLSTYKKKNTFASMVDYARILIKKSEPIRCLDGFILAAYLTCNLNKYCIRFPLRFMSKCKHKLYWHIVLAVAHTRSNKFGAIGISRKNEKLSYKQCEYDSLLSLVTEYMECYKLYGHQVKIITVGVPLTNNIHSEDPIFWDILEIHNKKEDNGVQTHRNTLNHVFEKFIKHKDSIIRSMTDDTKPYLFHNSIMFDIETKKYYLKKQYTKHKPQNKTTSVAIANKDKNTAEHFINQEDVNRV